MFLLRPSRFPLYSFFAFKPSIVFTAHFEASDANATASAHQPARRDSDNGVVSFDDEHAVVMIEDGDSAGTEQSGFFLFGDGQLGEPVIFFIPLISNFIIVELAQLFPNLLNFGIIIVLLIITIIILIHACVILHCPDSFPC